MSTPGAVSVLPQPAIDPDKAPAPEPARIALLGLGNVGSAALSRLQQWRDGPFGGRLRLVYAANSRQVFQSGPGLCAPVDDGLSPETSAMLRSLQRGRVPVDRPLQPVAAALGLAGCRIVIDATASQAVADQHPHWLRQGIHVVTACKLGQGTSLQAFDAIREACVLAGSHYGDSAAVGAGLPLLRSLRELRAGGDAIHAIAGVLSGSLAWLFNQYDGMRPFSGFVRQAREAGYTEPDPRDDLSGEDVRRKILILARSAGFPLQSEDVEVDSLVPPALAALTGAGVDAALPLLDEPLRLRFAQAHRNGEVLRFIARFADGRASVGLQAVAADHPLAGGSGTDNRVAIWSDRYRRQPLVIQGPGAGAEVTAAGLLDDALAIQRAASSATGDGLH